MSVVSLSPSSIERSPDRREVAVGVADRGDRSRPVDPGLDLQEAVALIVLRAVGIARPEDNDERLSIFLEFRQHDLRQSLGERILLHDVGSPSFRAS